MKNGEDSKWKIKIRKALAGADKIEWLFYLVVVSILIPFRLGLIQISYDEPAGFILLDFLIAVNIIAFSARLATTLRKKEDSPFVTCNNCGRRINPPPRAKWKCVCGMELKFPPSD